MTNLTCKGLLTGTKMSAYNKNSQLTHFKYLQIVSFGHENTRSNAGLEVSVIYTLSRRNYN